MQRALSGATGFRLNKRTKQWASPINQIPWNNTTIELFTLINIDPQEELLRERQATWL